MVRNKLVSVVGVNPPADIASGRIAAVLSLIHILDSIAEDAKAGYILEAEATLKQDGEKDTQDITLVVVKVDGKWVIVSGL